MAVEFGELPPKARAGKPIPKWAIEAREATMARPGEWAKVATLPGANAASQIKAGKLGFGPGFDAALRANGSEFDVWVKYEGADQ